MRDMSSGLSKSVRFDVFRRDKFTCIYCGRKPPCVILHVDHILPRVEGGGDTEDNLVTSCSDCNLGKGVKVLNEGVTPLDISLEERQERLDQLKAYQELLRSEEDFKRECLHSVIERWARCDGQDGEAPEWTIPSELENAARKFLKLLPLDEVLDSVEEAHGNSRISLGRRFKYFCGICWRKIDRIRKGNGGE